MKKATSTRTLWLTVFVWYFIFVQAYRPIKDWLLRPGTLYVCEGDKACFRWQLKNDDGELKAIRFSMVRPEWANLLNKLGEKDVWTFSKRIKFIQSNTFEILLENTSLSDSGRYELEMSSDDSKLLYHDFTELRVLPSSDCPGRRIFQNPPIYFIKHTGKRKDVVPVSKGTKLKVDYFDRITLQVFIPAADPSARCAISMGRNKFRCKGVSAREIGCEVGLSFQNAGYHEVVVNLTFVAFNASVTKFFFYVQEIEQGDGTIVPIQTSFEDRSDQLMITVFIVIFGIFLGILSIVLAVVCFLYLARKRNKSREPKVHTVAKPTYKLQITDEGNKPLHNVPGQ